MKFSIGMKIIGSFVIIALCIVVTSLISFFATNNLSNSYSELIDRSVTVKSNLQDIRFLTSEQALSLRGYMLTHDQKYADDVQERNKALSELIQVTMPIVQTSETANLLKQIDADNNAFKNIADESIAIAPTSFEKATQITMERAIPVTKRLLQKADDIVTIQQKAIQEQVQINHQTLNNLSLTLNIIGVTLVILSITVGIILTRMIGNPLRLLTENATKMASGDLTVPSIQVKSRDEIFNLAQS
ncbi:MAG TPA: MCP four helix bundle domain-containing protein, partial [Bacillota bacterium]|nr:MCP four helix bundle domain-containing protein [Bacillota bacterium]